MDAFFAAVEQRDNPALRNRPVIIGGDPNNRGVVSTCSYEARKYGVRSAMASSLAVRLCPQAVFLKPSMNKYIVVSSQIRAIFKEYTDKVEPLSLDEAYLDVTVNKKNIAYASKIAAEIRRKIARELGLTASAGVSYNKFLAKVASEVNKPDGMKVILPEKAAEFLDRLPIGDFYGVGRVTENKMRSLGITNGKQLKQFSQEVLVNQFGKSGLFFFFFVRGVDERDVVSNRIRKSIGKERTFAKDIINYQQMEQIIDSIAAEVSAIMQKKQRKGKTITLKVRYSNFQRSTRSITVDDPIDERHSVAEYARSLLGKTEVLQRSVRLLGVAVSGLN